MTLVEVLVVIVVLMILTVLLLPWLTYQGIRKPLYCVNNLKQIGLAYRIWETGFATNRLAIP